MKKKDDKMKNENENYWMPIGMCLGMCLGAGIGAATNELAIYMPIGMCLGLCIGLALDETKKKKK